MGYFPAICQNSNCRARRTLSKPPEQYERGPFCPFKHCKRFCRLAKKWIRSRMRLDVHRIAQRKLPPKVRNDPGPVCKCDARPGRDNINMPHRAGSIQECRYYTGSSAASIRIFELDNGPLKRKQK